VRPSPAVILRGREDVLNFFREIESQGGDRLYEAKALLVGKGGAGKTSLLRRLCHPELPLPEQDESTRGIEVDRHTIRAMGKLLPEHSLSAWCAGMAAIAVPAIGAAWGKGVLSGFQVAAAYLACGIAWTAWFLEKRRKARADASAEEERVADEEDRRAKGADKRAELECAATGPEPELRTIRIFLASSDELRADRDDFDLYFQHLNKEFFGRGLRIGIDRWEFSSDAMSRMRLQDEYNKKVEAADIFVSLFETKVGKFTEEEFDVAWRSFKDKGSPRIFTYFKKAYVPADPCSLPGLTTLERFQTKLKDAGHYWTPYETAEHLKRHFREQLAKLYPGQQSG
jgi:GTPase SAR1 family protein